MATSAQDRPVMRRFFRHRLAILGSVTMLVIIITAIFAPLIAPHDPNVIDFISSDRPSEKHLLGLDPIGRDVLSRLIYASRISLTVGLVSVTLNTVIGVLIGGIAGYAAGRIDGMLMRLTDAVLSFPSLMLIVVVVSLVGPSIYNVMLVLGLLGWPHIARLVRAEFLRIRELDYVLAARAVGVPSYRIIFRHMLPNASGTILVAATFGVAQAIIVEASLSFLGLGVQPPTASWGNMLSAAQSLAILETKPWQWVPPGVAIFVAVLSINFIGDGLRDALDPKLK